MNENLTVSYSNQFVNESNKQFYSDYSKYIQTPQGEHLYKKTL